MSEPANKKETIERIARVVSNNFEHDIGGFCFQRWDYEEMMPLFGIEDLKTDFEEYAKELGKDLEITIEVGDINVWVSWKPKDADDR